jgi:hypothetical protein
MLDEKGIEQVEENEDIKSQDMVPDWLEVGDKASEERCPGLALWR